MFDSIPAPTDALAVSTRPRPLRRQIARHGVRRGTVERVPPPVVAARRARVGVPCCVLHVAQRHASVERGRDEPVAQRMRGDDVFDPCRARQAPHDLERCMTIHPPAAARGEQRPGAPAREHHVERGGSPWRERDRLALAALPPQPERAVSALVSQVRHVGRKRLGDAQAVEHEQARERVVARTPARTRAARAALRDQRRGAATRRSRADGARARPASARSTPHQTHSRRSRPAPRDAVPWSPAPRRPPPPAVRTHRRVRDERPGLRRRSPRGSRPMRASPERKPRASLGRSRQGTPPPARRHP